MRRMRLARTTGSKKGGGVRPLVALVPMLLAAVSVLGAALAFAEPAEKIDAPDPSSHPPASRAAAPCPEGTAERAAHLIQELYE